MGRGQPCDVGARLLLHGDRRRDAVVPQLLVAKLGGNNGTSSQQYHATVHGMSSRPRTAAARLTRPRTIHARPGVRLEHAMRAWARSPPHDIHSRAPSAEQVTPGWDPAASATHDMVVVAGIAITYIGFLYCSGSAQVKYTRTIAKHLMKWTPKPITMEPTEFFLKSSTIFRCSVVPAVLFASYHVLMQTRACKTICLLTLILESIFGLVAFVFLIMISNTEPRLHLPAEEMAVRRGHQNPRLARWQSAPGTERWPPPHPPPPGPPPPPPRQPQPPSGESAPPGESAPSGEPQQTGEPAPSGEPQPAPSSPNPGPGAQEAPDSPPAV